MIDYDVTVTPMGPLGMQRLLGAVESAHPNDESEWIEFKADLDPTSKEGAATIAKAIVAFANRDPDRAQRWCAGHAYIVIGLAPGNVAGAAEIDPAVLHDKVNMLLADPAPHWDPTPLTYAEKHVIVITVAPPRAGDPIACIGRSSGEVVDGNVYVRVPGKSERAKAADIRRLSTRLAPVGETLRDLVVTTAGTIASVDYDDDWMTRWIEDEEDRLLAPLTPEPEPEAEPDPVTRLSSLGPAALAGLSWDLPAYRKMEPFIRTGAGMRSQAERLHDMLTERHEEDRTEEEYRAAVESYLDRCRERLPEAFEAIRSAEATPVTFSVTNNTDRNFTAVEIRAHVEGDVFGYHWVEDFKGWSKYVGSPPRVWGPWTETKASALGMLNNCVGVKVPPYRPQTLEALRPQPRIENGGSVNIECVPVDLRPGDTKELVTVHLVADRTVMADVRVTWAATATDADGKLTGEFTIPLADERVNLDLSRD